MSTNRTRSVALMTKIVWILIASMLQTALSLVARRGKVVPVLRGSVMQIPQGRLSRLYSSSEAIFDAIEDDEDVLDVVAPSLTLKDLPEETLYILDGTSMLFQAFYSRESRLPDFADASFHHTFVQDMLPRLSDRVRGDLQLDLSITSSPVDNRISCSALVVMAHQFARFIRDVKPSYVAAAFDVSRSSLLRLQQLPSYKQQRAATPAELVPQLMCAPRLLSALGVRCFGAQGHEADDVMASLSRWAREKGLNCVHVSPDKDMLQLLDTGVHVWTPKGFISPDDVQTKFGVTPKQIPDLFALTGDRVDNIPGAKGIGLKTAAALIDGFGSLENLYKSLHLQGKVCPVTFDANELKTADEKAVLIAALTQSLTTAELQEAVQCLEAALPATILRRYRPPAGRTGETASRR